MVFQFSFVFQATFIELPSEIFQQSSKTHFEPKRFELRRKVSTESSKRHFTCPEEHFYKNNMLTSWNNFRLWARKCRICGGKFAALLSNLHFCLRMGNWKNSFERFFIFHIFSDLQVTFFGFFCWIILGMVVKTAFFMPRRTYAIEKIFWQNFFYSISDYEGYFRKLPLKFLMHGCQDYSLRVQGRTLRRVPDYEGKFLNFHWNFLGMVVKTTVYVFRGALWERLSFFWDFFRIVFGLWAIIVQTSVETFQQRCQNWILRVQRTSRFSLQ